MLGVIYIGKAYKIKVGRKDRTKLYKLGWTERMFIKWANRAKLYKMGRTEPSYIRWGGQSQALKSGADREKVCI